MSDAYDFRPGGSLKLKGGVAEGGVKKKKSSKTKSKSDKEKVKQRREEQVANQDEVKAAGNGSASTLSGSKADDRKTDAERRFEEIQKQRRTEKVAKLAAKTHKDRVQEFNEKLEALSEHHDIPKVGPG